MQKLSDIFINHHASIKPLGRIILSSIKVEKDGLIIFKYMKTKRIKEQISKIIKKPITREGKQLETAPTVLVKRYK